MGLITNRNLDPLDLLLNDRDARDGKLLPRAGQGGPKSDRGKARRAWAESADTTEEALLEFFAHFRFDLAYDLTMLRSNVSLLMTAAGLRSDDNAVNLGADWIAHRVIEGQRVQTYDDIKQAVDELSLRAGSPWATISIATLSADPVADQALIALDWVDRMKGDTSWEKVEPAPPVTWEDLAADIANIPQQLNGQKRILVTGTVRQATGFFLGAELRQVLGFDIAVRQLDQVWTGDTPTAPYDLRVDEKHVGNGNDLALIVNVATDATDTVINWLRAEQLPVEKALAISPDTSPGPKALPTPQAANSLAIAIRNFARQHAPDNGDIHLFLAGPLGLAVLLGHHWNRVAITRVYEHLGATRYAHAFTVTA
jgi:hypothetical protein